MDDTNVTDESASQSSQKKKEKNIATTGVFSENQPQCWMKTSLSHRICDYPLLNSHRKSPCLLGKPIHITLHSESPCRKMRTPVSPKV